MKRSANAIYNIYDQAAMTEVSEPVKRPATKLDMGTLPMYEQSDLFASSASAFNKAMDYTYEPSFLSEDMHKMDEATIRYQLASGAFSGGRHVRQADLPPFKLKYQNKVTIYRIPENHLLNVRAEAPRGLHAINPLVRDTVDKQKVKTTGAANSVRRSGWERYGNPKIYPELPVGLPMSTEPQRAVSDSLRINNNLVDPIATFPSLGF